MAHVYYITQTNKQASKTICVETLALQYRQALVRRLQRLYFLPPHPATTTASQAVLATDPSYSCSRDKGRGAYGLLLMATAGAAATDRGGDEEEEDAAVNKGGLVDNPDQRVTADVDTFSTKLATVLGQVLAVPGLIVYCT